MAEKHEQLVTLSLQVPISFIKALDALSAKFQDPSPPSLFEWMSSSTAGRKFFHDINQPGHPYRSLSQAALSKVQRDLYRKDYQVRSGPKQKRAARLKVLQLALEAYTSQQEV